MNNSRIPEVMQAVRVREPGGVDVLELCERPVPKPGSGEVLLEVRAAGVNRADIILRQPDLPLAVAKKPEIPGLEVAGIVRALGEDVTGLAIGDRFCALVPAAGGYAQYCAVPAALGWKVPDSFGIEQAAALPEALLTIWNALFDEPVLRPGETLLVHGGTSGIGSMAIMLAATRGAQVLATAGSDEKCAAMEAWGARRCINYRHEDFVAAVREATAGKGVDVILDIVAGSYINRNVDALAVGGRLVQIGMMENPSGMLNIAPLMAKRARIIGATIFFQSVEEKAVLARRIHEQVWPLVENGALRPVIDRICPLAEAVDAQRRMESSRHIGKILLRP